MTTPPRPVVRRLFAVTASLVVIAGCGSHDGSHSGSTPVASIPADADHNEADVAFAQEMIPHHEQAIEMAEIALDPNAGASDAVRSLAQAVADAQEPAIRTMNDWLKAWNQPTMEELPDHDMSSMKGMMSADDMAALGAAKGAEFDRMWLEMMIAHHEGAVEMASGVLAGGRNPDVKALAQQVSDSQSAEIAEMKALLGA